jgi:hypothetical protein
MVWFGMVVRSSSKDHTTLWCKQLKILIYAKNRLFTLRRNADVESYYSIYSYCR